jgi:hypothetical protein
MNPIARMPRFAAAVGLCAVAFNANADSCATEPLLTLEDAEADFTGAVDAPAGLPFHDLLSLAIGQAPGDDGETLLRFQLKVGSMPPVPAPNAVWYASFDTPEETKYGVRLQTDNEGAISYFSYMVAPGGLNNDGPSDGRFVVTGSEHTAQPGSGYEADGTITIIVKASAVGVSPGQVLGPFNAATIQGGDLVAASFAATVDQMPDTLSRDGFYDVQDCSAKSGFLGVGGVGLSLLAPLALLGLRRRVLAGAALALLSGNALAADPESGTVSEAAPELTYTFPLAPVANVSGLLGLVPGQSPNYTCDAVNPCDEFALTLDLPADYLETYPDAQVRVAAATDEKDLDIDLQVSDESGNVVYITRDNPPEQPTVLIIPKGGVEKFIVQVAHGTPHTGGSTLIRLEPGDAAKSGTLFGGALNAGLLISLAGLGLLRRRTGAVAGLLALAAGGAWAATPENGVITDTQTSVEFSGGPYAVPNVTNVLQLAEGETVCEEGTPSCDVFRFEVNLADVNVDDDQLVITVSWDDSIPDAPADDAPKLPDYDLELYNDATGEFITQQATGDNPEILVTLPNNGKYQLRIIPYAPMDVPYAGKVEFVRFEEEESKSLTLFGGALGGSALSALVLLLLARARRQVRFNR